MKITFTNNPDNNYFVTKYYGEVTDDFAFEETKKFLNSDEWIPGSHELADLSEVNFNKVTSNGIQQLAFYVNQFYSAHNVSHVKVAIYAPHALPYGIASVYAAFADDSPELISVFKDKNEAIAWLTSQS